VMNVLLCEKRCKDNWVF